MRSIRQSPRDPFQRARLKTTLTLWTWPSCGIWPQDGRRLLRKPSRRASLLELYRPLATSYETNFSSCRPRSTLLAIRPSMVIGSLAAISFRRSGPCAWLPPPVAPWRAPRQRLARLWDSSPGLCDRAPRPARGPAAASFAARMEWLAWFQALHPPSDPLAHATTHDPFEVVAFEPRHLFGEHGDALTICTR